MSNKSVIIISVILVLILVAIALTVSISASGQFGFLDKKEDMRNKNMQKADSSRDLVYGSDYQRNACNPAENTPCFKYPELEQTRLNSFKYPKVEQTRLEPCPKPKPVCPICLNLPEQVHGVGHMDKINQISLSC